MWSILSCGSGRGLGRAKHHSEVKRSISGQMDTHVVMIAPMSLKLDPRHFKTIQNPY